LREREIYGAKLTSQQSFIQVQKRVCFVTLAHGCSPGSRSVLRSLSALLQWRLTDCDCNATQRNETHRNRKKSLVLVLQKFFPKRKRNGRWRSCTRLPPLLSVIRKIKMALLAWLQPQPQASALSLCSSVLKRALVYSLDLFLFTRRILVQK
jgi:hypothetical protein